MKIRFSPKTYPRLRLATLYAEEKKLSLTIETDGANSIHVTEPNAKSSTEKTELSALVALGSFLGLMPEQIVSITEVEHWLNFAINNLNGKDSSLASSLLSYLNSHLTANYLVGGRLTVADVALFATLATSHQSHCDCDSYPNIRRYFAHLRQIKSFAKFSEEVGVTCSKNQSATTMTGEQQAKANNNAPKARKQEGKYIDLPGSEMGKVVVRFPPEASGYLHIGHAKAALLNQYYQQAFEGKLILRFDDTNPAKETEHFEEIILEDLKKLGVKYDIFTRSSDHFEKLLGFCEQLIKQGDAYVDNTDAETMKKQREAREESANRSNTVEQNLKLWEEMKKGSEVGQRCCVRAKIDMKHNNGCLRDPTLYRCKNEEHVATGNKYKVYPTYDFACPIVDSVEGVTHALRTTEYHDRDEQYYWVISKLGLRKPHIWEYARLNLQNTVMSKRKLTWLVDNGYVMGWDDPRLPTVRGVFRRGMTVEGLKEFVIAQGSSKSVVTMDWSKIWAINKQVIDPIAPRFVAVLKENAVEVTVEGAEESSKQHPKHPKNDTIGEKTVWYSKKIIVDQADAALMKDGEVVTFVNWGNSIVKKVGKSTNNLVERIECKLNLENTDYKNTQKYTWLSVTEKAPLIPTVCVHFGPILSKPVLGKDDDFKDCVNTDSLFKYEMLGEPALAHLKKGEIIQLMRRGYFRVDEPYQAPDANTCRAHPCVLFHVPDGHTKELPTAVTASTAAKAAETTTKKGSSPPPAAAAAAPAATGSSADAINDKIVDQGNKIRQLKQEKAAKAVIDVEVQTLLALKAEYLKVAGRDWAPGAAPAVADPKKPAPTAAAPASKPSAAEPKKMTAGEVDRLNEEITKQGDKIRQLKSAKADKASIDVEVKTLLSLKADYAKVAGKDWAPPPAAGGADSAKKPAAAESKKENVPKPESAKSKEPKKQEAKKDDAKHAAAQGDKKVTRLGLEAKKEDDFAEWYSQVITKSELIEYYDISGCYVLRPTAYAIWERIQAFFDAKIKALGVENCYFPLFVSKAALEREKTHISDFAPEVAWVTKSGNSDLAEPIAIRPTSETVMYPAFARWVQSYRDLPIRLNQWCSVVRWEFKNPQPFIRTREFLWQEGHSAFATSEEAKKEVFDILDLYSQVYENLLAIPVVKGKKTLKERFAGADFTTTTELYIPMSGRGLQGATSHHLGQNFSKMFGIEFEDPNDSKKKVNAFQNSWGISTRSIGALVMIHGDNNGLVLPPRVAITQVVIVPVGITASTSDEKKTELFNAATRLCETLTTAGVRAKTDLRDHVTPGWKFNHWELKGIPIRIELGPRELEHGDYVLVRRDTSEKSTRKLAEASKEVGAVLEEIHHFLYNKAKKSRDEHTATCTKWSDFCEALAQRKVIMAPFCGAVACEESIKDESAKAAQAGDGTLSMGAKSLCIPFDQKPLPANTPCINPHCAVKSVEGYTLFGRSY